MEHGQLSSSIIEERRYGREHPHMARYNPLIESLLSRKILRFEEKIKTSFCKEEKKVGR
jgi:hypothetical protein